MRWLRLTLCTALLILSTSCGGLQNTLDPAGPAARDISSLTWIIYIMFCSVALIMWALLLWVVLRRRGTLAEHEPIDVGGGQDWIITGGFIIPFVILATVFILGLHTLSAFPVNDNISQAKPEIRVTGHQWWWEIDYLSGPVDQHFKTANEIHIPVGKPVDIELMTADVIHSFWVPQLHGKEDLIPGQPNLIRIQADQPGIYHGQCAEYCGAQHANMRLLVIADDAAAYQSWLQSQLADALDPVNDEERAGQRLFMGRPCALCHTIRGTDAHGMVGPDLTHLASRRGIAANMLVNNEANLEAWVTHAQSLKPGCRMPNITQFSGGEARTLMSYLQSLE